jgi:hypothetical protein
MKRVALGKYKVLLRNGANILKIIIYERFILNFSILGLIFHNLSKKCLNWVTDASSIPAFLRSLRKMKSQLWTIIYSKDRMPTDSVER